MAFLDDVYAVGDRPKRLGAVHIAIQEELRTPHRGAPGEDCGIKLELHR